jgi:hypothetical protein
MAGLFIGEHVSGSTPSLIQKLQEPKLSQRGYAGELVSYEIGMRYVKQETQPEGWEELLHAITKKAQSFFNEESNQTLRGCLRSNLDHSHSVLTTDSMSLKI